MKMNKNLYLFAAVLVAGTMGMTSCSNEVIPETEINPTFDGESVKTQFALNIPAGKSTRMSATNTQQESNPFLGMQNIKLLPMFTAPTGTYNQEIKQIISLDEIAKDGGLSNQTKIYQDVNIPVSTKHFLFYGEAKGTKDGTAMGTTDDAFAQGVLLNTLNDGATSSIDKINFNLLKITSKNDFVNSTENEGPAKAILDALKAVVDADNGNWKTYATTPTNSGNVLAELYESFISLKAGSAKSVKFVLTDLKTALGKLDASSYSGSVDINDIITAIDGAINASTGTLKDNTFPNDYNLPDGAVELKWTSDVPSYTFTEADNGGVTMGNMALKPENICYPASLSYFVSTPIKVTADKSPQFPDSLTNWAGVSANWGSGWTDGAVQSTTTAIALKNPIQYAVANLKTVVRCKNAVLEDNAKAAGGEIHPRKVTVPSDGFPVTGVLVGGQPKSVNWNFVPGSNDAGDRALMVYDKADSTIVRAKAATDFTDAKANYTLVLDNRKTTGTLNDADVVNIAIELQNNTGTDFYGVDGIVKAGATFYLVGQLKTLNIGGNATSGTDERKSVFEQDYTTTAQLTIGSLKNAYNCIPDLRSTQLQLGLAVDLTWNSGIVFDVEL